MTFGHRVYHDQTHKNSKTRLFAKLTSELSKSNPLDAVKQPSFCPNHWVAYGGNCYFIERSKKMWKDALTACRRDDADLATVHNIEEQSFIIAQSGYRKTREASSI